MRISENFVLNTPKLFRVPGNYLYFASVPGGTVTAVLFKDGRALPEDLAQVIAGWYAEPDGGFDEVEVTSTLTQAIAFYISKGKVGANVFSGSVSVTSTVNPIGLAHTRTARQVTNVSQVLLAANASRRFLSIQNIDPTGNLFIREDGTAATADNNSLKIYAGGAPYEPLVVPTGEIRGILDVASAVNNVHIIEG